MENGVIADVKRRLQEGELVTFTVIGGLVFFNPNGNEVLHDKKDLDDLLKRIYLDPKERVARVMEEVDLVLNGEEYDLDQDVPEGL